MAKRFRIQSEPRGEVEIGIQHFFIVLLSRQPDMLAHFDDLDILAFPFNDYRLTAFESEEHGVETTTMALMPAGKSC